MLGVSASCLQQIFDGILREAESKLLDATIEALQIEEQQLKDGCVEEKQKVVTSIEAWRSSFQSSDPSLDIEADEFVKSAKSFADYFYFECAAKRTSKRLADSIQKANKAAKNTERMVAFPRVMPLGDVSRPGWFARFISDENLPKASSLLGP